MAVINPSATSGMRSGNALAGSSQSKASHKVVTPPKAVMIQAPRTSQERHWGRSNTYRNRPGRSRSITKSNPVRPSKASEIRPRPISKPRSIPAIPSRLSNNGIASTPAAMDLVHRYPVTSHPHSTPRWGVS